MALRAPGDGDVAGDGVWRILPCAIRGTSEIGFTFGPLSWSVVAPLIGVIGTIEMRVDVISAGASGVPGELYFYNITSLAIRYTATTIPDPTSFRGVPFSTPVRVAFGALPARPPIATHKLGTPAGVSWGTSNGSLVFLAVAPERDDVWDETVGNDVFSGGHVVFGAPPPVAGGVVATVVVPTMDLVATFFNASRATRFV